MGEYKDVKMTKWYLGLRESSQARINLEGGTFSWGADLAGEATQVPSLW